VFETKHLKPRFVFAFLPMNMDKNVIFLLAITSRNEEFALTISPPWTDRLH